MRRVVLHKGVSDHLSLNTMVDGLAAAFARRGLVPAVLDLTAPDYPARIRALLEEGGIALFVCLNGMGLPREAGTFYDRLGIPVVALFVDHPFYHLDRLAVPLPRLFLTFPSRSHVAFCRQSLGLAGPLLHLPHAAAEMAVAVPAERDIQILYSGSPLAADPEGLRDRWRRLGRESCAALEAIVAAHDAAPARPLEAVVAEILGQPPEAVARLRPFFLAADAYLRSRIKVEALKALAAAGIEVAVCGQRWEAVPGSRRLLGSRDVPATLGLMARSRMVLNLLPPYYESHERVFQAMAAGARAATTPAELWADLFGAGECLALPCDPRDLARSVADALADPAALARDAERGREAFAGAHTWDHRVGSLLDFLATHGENAGP